MLKKILTSFLGIFSFSIYFDESIQKRAAQSTINARF